MHASRNFNLKEISDFSPESSGQNIKISDFFGENVFYPNRMREYLSNETFDTIQKASLKGLKMERETADIIASAMKDWALEKGATHYTHWFQPLSGSTAEKHEAFLKTIDSGKVIEQFNGSLLIQQESDASSFPNGGIRNTFETRGYTAWDPSSPAFIISKTLCIPTIFIAYTGEALDYKTPLIKALEAMDKSAVDICRYFDKNIKKVNVTLGWEQEYFLVDRKFFNARPDILMTGRVLFGKAPAKEQQLEDHYFGSIPLRVNKFMQDFEVEALKLGIPVVTRHNEVAPNQFECAPIFEECNLANDHNLLLMVLMNKIAAQHKLKVLFHEKPFPKVNGSGKHNNWSLSTNTGINLLSPGENPENNLLFLTFFVNTIKAIHKYNDLLRASVASVSNDHRLGGMEAPPAIISVYIGSFLSSFLDNLEKSIKKEEMTSEKKLELKLNISKIPQILLDNTDRNRTSPFAFTGNKFEFRAVGSSANCAQPMIVLNTIVAKQLKEFKKNIDRQITKGTEKEEAILIELQKLIKESKPIRFEGNGYSEEWKTEAKARGLKELKDTPSALEVWEDEKNIQVFEDMNILSKKEILARQEIDYEKYVKQIQIEARILSELILANIIPAVINYQNVLIQNITGIQGILNKSEEPILLQKHLLDKISKRLTNLHTLSALMQENRKKANLISDKKAKAFAYRENVLSLFDSISYEINKLEALTDDSLWPFPKLRDMLFVD